MVEHVRSDFTIRVRLLLPEGGCQFVKPNGGFWVPPHVGDDTVCYTNPLVWAWRPVAVRWDRFPELSTANFRVTGENAVELNYMVSTEMMVGSVASLAGVVVRYTPSWATLRANTTREYDDRRTDVEDLWIRTSFKFAGYL